MEPLGRERQLVFALHATRARSHHEEAVPQVEGLLYAVGDQNDRLARLLPELQDETLHLLPGEGIEGTQRLVHEDDLGIVGEASGQGDPLLHATGEFVDRLVTEALQAHRGQQVLDQLVGLGSLLPVHPGSEGNVLGH